MGTMLALNSVTGSVLNPLITPANNVKQLKTVDVHLARLHDVTAERSETRLLEGGAGLSGGQRQRLARALVGRPRILLLDEASSHLDANTEERIDEDLRTLDRARLMITHRLSTVRDADVILVVHDGRVVEHGTHDISTAPDDCYAELVAAQLSAGEIRNGSR